MKFIRKIAHSRFALPVCGLLALMALVYIAFAVRQIVTNTPLGERLLLLPELMTEQEMQVLDGEHTPELPEESEQDIFTAQDEVKLPMAGPEISSKEPQTLPLPELTLPVPETEPEPPPSAQRPTTGATTKPPASTQKPAQTTKPQNTPASKPETAPITAWNVTYKQAKSMVKADAAYDYEDLYWLARVISAEAKGESFTGQIGVGTVVLNRVRSKEFPNTVKGVVFDQKYGTQFTPVANGTIYQTPTASAVVAAKMCLDGYTLSNSVLYFLNPRIATSSWIVQNRKYAFRIGNHDFYY
jgi:spore germination cell wall hydrolase CwlJ-like protein